MNQDGVFVPVPPPYGTPVFTATKAAAADLVSILSDKTVPNSTLVTAGSEIVEADQAIANEVFGLGIPTTGGLPFGTLSPTLISASQINGAWLTRPPAARSPTL